MDSKRPDVPVDELMAAAGDAPDAHGAIGDFHRAYSEAAPDAAALRAHAERVRGIATVAGPFERWWLSPGVQAFIAELGATGL
jgi:hypothetical protein